MTRTPTTPASLLFGSAIAFWMFGLAFTRSTEQFKGDMLVPLMVCALGTMVLVLVLHGSGRRIVIAVVAPIVVLNGFFFLTTAQPNGGPEWGHLLTALKMVVAAGVGAMAGQLLRGRLGPNRPE